MLTVDVLPVRRHAEKPAVEEFPPVRIVAGDEVGQCADTVLAVPMSGAVQIFFDGVVQGNGVRVR